MSTRSLILFTDPKDDSLLSVYCHNDGHIESNGAMLVKNYNSPRKAKGLCSNGNLASLHEMSDANKNLPSELMYLASYPEKKFDWLETNSKFNEIMNERYTDETQQEKIKKMNRDFRKYSLTLEDLETKNYFSNLNTLLRDEEQMYGIEFLYNYTNNNWHVSDVSKNYIQLGQARYEELVWVRVSDYIN